MSAEPLASDDAPKTTPSEKTTTVHWDRLGPPPRDVSEELRLRLRWAEASGPPGFAAGAGALLLIGGLVYVVAGPVHGAVGLIPMLVGLAILATAVSVAFRRAERALLLLREGRPATATIVSIWDRNRFAYVPYDDAVQEWSRFRQQTGGGFAAVAGLLARQLRHWPCKVRISDETAGPSEIEARLDLGPLLTRDVEDPVVGLLFHASEGDALMAGERYPWLTVSADGGWEIERTGRIPEIGRSFLRSFGPVLATYCLAAIGLTWGFDSPFAEVSAQIPAVIGAGVVLLFTLTHAVVPVFFYRPFFAARPAAEAAGASAPPGFWLAWSGFIHLHMGFWYGVPMVALGAMTGWLNLPWAAAHVALARRGTRHWVFLEYGSTSLALLLFVVCFSGDRLFPLGIAVVLFQSLLLTIMDWKGRDLWISERP